MNNYKIIEDRPDPTPELVAAGMSFGIIQKNLPAPKKVSLNTLIAAGISAVVIISAVFIYRSFSSQPDNKKQEPVINDIVKENTTPLNSDTVIAKEKNSIKEKNIVDTSN